MSIVVNQDLLADGDDAESSLPDGVYPEADWKEWKAAKTLPEGRTELFTANGRVYTAPSYISPSVTFRYMKAMRQRSGEENAMADLLYETLGDAIMDHLASEDLSADEFRQVMTVVRKHVAGAAQKVLGN